MIVVRNGLSGWPIRFSHDLLALLFLHKRLAVSHKRIFSSGEMDDFLQRMDAKIIIAILGLGRTGYPVTKESHQKPSCTGELA
ncbi:MAG: hypothetical protein KC643_22155 [Nitrospira sp.]|nr:hypothetical protein [Nitrospira sp.]